MTIFNSLFLACCSWRCSQSPCSPCAYLPPRRCRGASKASAAAADRRRRRPNPWLTRIIKLTGPLAKLSVPDEGWENSLMRTRFMNAGFRKASAPVIFFAAKTALAVGLPLMVFFTASACRARNSVPTAAVLAVVRGSVRLLPAQHDPEEHHRAPAARVVRELSGRARPDDRVRRGGAAHGRCAGPGRRRDRHEEPRC